MISSGWRKARIGEIAEVKGGKRLPAGYYLQATPTHRPYIRVADMRVGGVDQSDIKYVPEGAISRIQNYRIYKDDIFISVAGTLGIVGRVPISLDGANLTENADRLTNIKCDVAYLMYALQSNPIQDEIDSIRTVGAQPKLALSRIRSFEILMPSDQAEQSRVSRALSDTDDLIESLERLISKKQAIKQGMMQELLTGRTRLPGFTAEWKESRLGSFGTFLKGRGIKRDEIQSRGVPCIRYGELYTTFENYTEQTASFVSDDIAATALPIRYGDILFAGSGETKAEIGTNVAYLGKVQAVAGGDIIVFRGISHNPVFLSSLLNSPAIAAQKARAGQGDAIVHIHSSSLAEIVVNVPPIEEQEAIAQILQDADKEIAALDRRLETARNIKTGMMQELLTGRTRLPVEEVSS